MKYRGIEYRVVQGTGRNNWSWSVALGERPLTGRSRQNGAAIIAAERAIDEAFGHSPRAPVAPPPATASSKNDLAEGDRCVLTPLGQRQCPAIGGRLGTVVNADGLLTVVFDGLDRASMFHESYVQRVTAFRELERSNAISEDCSGFGAL